MAPVACLDDHPNQCERAATCKTLQMWEGFYKLINEYFDGITLEDLLEQNSKHGRLRDLTATLWHKAAEHIKKARCVLLPFLICSES